MKIRPEPDVPDGDECGGCKYLLANWHGTPRECELFFAFLDKSGKKLPQCAKDGELVEPEVSTNNSEKAAREWKNRYEGMAVLYSNVMNMIESGKLLYAENVMPTIERLETKTDEPLIKIAHALAVVGKHEETRG